ncbi:hypothetical protein LMH87_005469 [Akanthomyces muscarius]|uniref:Uncharacterized protein n=1 Tax=Akanthomyces muscarius TaxID=2231603 RepID=A0A9W8QNC0_AKAMU|nr:hypothetical protein LMH87_005469 [Akanthomyces muscarius]KAJ4163761.1 hypothetical protein LMH87_005469 [Akanthomyces muscarius]
MRPVLTTKFTKVKNCRIMCRPQCIIVYFKCSHIQGPAWELTPDNGCGGCQKLIGEIPAGMPRATGNCTLPIPCFPCIVSGEWRIFQETWMSTEDAIAAGWEAPS